MQLKYINNSILQDLIDRCRFAMEQMPKCRPSEAVRVLFNLNFYIAVRLRLIRPIDPYLYRMAFTAGFYTTGYSYLISDINAHSVVNSQAIALRDLLPSGISIESSAIPEQHTEIYTFSCAGYLPVSITIPAANNIAFCIACLQFIQKTLLTSHRHPSKNIKE